VSPALSLSHFSEVTFTCIWQSAVVMPASGGYDLFSLGCKDPGPVEICRICVFVRFP
jgi:hypothetical protein